MTAELVSVIVPSYQREYELYRALVSLTKQTHTNLEIIVVDDNGDSSWNGRVSGVMERFAREYPDVRVRCIQNETNCGSAKTRNIGVEASSGSYVCFLDDDDVYLPEKISHQLSAMVAAKADFSVTDLMLYDEEDRLVDVRKRDYIGDGSGLLTSHMLYNITGTDTIMFKKSYLMEIGGFEPIDIGDDFYVITKAIRAGGTFVYAPGCHIKAYVHKGEVGLSSGQRKIAGEKQLYAFKRTFAGELGRKNMRYIRMRHHAVLAYAYLRIHKYGMFCLEGVQSVLAAPLASVRLLGQMTGYLERG